MGGTSARCRVAAVLPAVALLAACASGRPDSPPKSTPAAPLRGVTVDRSSTNGAHSVGDGRTICIGPKRNGECFPAKGRDGWTLAAQDRLSAWAQRVDVAVGDDTGFADLALDFKRHGVIVYFHGATPSRLAAIVTRAKHDGVLIKPVRARFGEQELDRAAIRLGHGLDAAHIRWNSIGADGKWSRVEIGGPVVSVNRQVQGRARRIARDTIGNIPIAFVPDPGVVDAGNATVVKH